MPEKDATPPVWDALQLRIASDAAGVALWSWNVDTNRIALDARARSLWDVEGAEVVTFEELSARIHPEDLDRVRAAFAATREKFGGYEIDFRILRRGAVNGFPRAAGATIKASSAGSCSASSST